MKMNMNIFHQYYRLFPIIALLCMMVTSCKDDAPDIPVIDPNEPANPGTIKDILNCATTEWGISRENIISFMEGYAQITSTGNDMLQFKAPESQLSISYQLYNNKLSATVILIPTVNADFDLQSLLNGYTHIGGLSDGQVYENLSKNTMATVWQPADDDNTFSAIGFAPIVSEAYEAVQPITVATESNVTIDMFTATASGSVSGVDTDVEVGFIYGMTDNLSEISGKKVSTTSRNNFTMALKGLVDESTYYYRAYAVVDEIYYFGEIHSFITGQYTYTIDGNTYKMVRVEGGTMPSFCIMQTELPPNSDLWIGSDNIGKVNPNCDPAIIKSEFQSFLNRLREVTGLPFRLPTREEWEFAARGGNKNSDYTYSGSNTIDDVAWYTGNSNRTVHDIATKKPNELGLYDMSGNYAELCNNTQDIYYVDDAFCGGSWQDAASDCTVSSWKPGSVAASKIPGTQFKEYNAIDARYISMRLVYSRQEE